MVLQVSVRLPYRRFADALLCRCFADALPSRRSEAGSPSTHIHSGPLRGPFGALDQKKQGTFLLEGRGATAATSPPREKKLRSLSSPPPSGAGGVCRAISSTPPAPSIGGLRGTVPPPRPMFEGGGDRHKHKTRTATWKMDETTGEIREREGRGKFGETREDVGFPAF